jgi:superfamily I DNA/RNA helicase
MMVELTAEQQAILDTCRPPLAPPTEGGGWVRRKGSGGRIVRITASAGSGKTTTLLQLASHAVLKCGHERICYATFTTAAAKDGKERMCRALEEATLQAATKTVAPPVIEARTLHSFAYRLLEDHRQMKNNSESNKSSSPPRMWSDKKLKKWIADVCGDEMDRFLTQCYLELQRRANSSGSSSTQENKLQSQKERAFEQVLFFIYKSLVLFTQSSMDIAKFQDDKKAFGRDYYPAKIFHKNKGEDYGFLPAVYNQQDKISFYSDQAAKCWRLIDENDDIRTFDLDMKRVQLLKLRVPGTILLVDESQDMDACQIDFIVHQQAELHRRHVYVVGDPAQAIYGFRGAKPKFLLQLGCNEKMLLTHTFRFGPGVCNIANMILFAKEKSDQTQYGKLDKKPIYWDPYRAQSGIPDKESIITTDRSILEDWKSGQVALIARTNTMLLLEILPLFGFSFSEENDSDYKCDSCNEEEADDDDIEKVKSQGSGSTARSTPTVTQDEENDDDDDDYLPYSEHHKDPDEDAAEKVTSMGENHSHGFPKVHLNGKGQASGRNLWLKTLKQVESAYHLYDICTKDPEATGFLDPKQFPDFDKGAVSWRTFCNEVEAKEMNKYANVIGVVSKCKDKTLQAMETFREEVIMKNVPMEVADIVLTTCHSAKGMEWERVQLCDDFVSLCTFEKKNDTVFSIYDKVIQGAKRQKRRPEWKFGFQSWSDGKFLTKKILILFEKISVMHNAHCTMLR